MTMPTHDDASQRSAEDSVAAAGDLRASGDARYDAVMARARGALAEMEGLPPSAWVRIRAGVDEAPSTARPAGFLAAWRPLLTLGAVAVAAVALVLAWPDAVTDPSPAPPVAQGEAPSARTPGGGAAGTPTADPAPSVAVGDLLAADAAPLELTAFGRHSLTLAAGGRARVARFDEEGVVLELLSGSLRSDVHRRSATEIFEVQSVGVTVRVVGTTFTVERAGAGTSVSVEHGIVAATGADGTEQRLTAGESRRFGAAAPPAVPAPATPIEPAQADVGADPAPPGEAGGGGQAAEPDRPVQRPQPSRRIRAHARGETTVRQEGDLKIIEIDVPDQAAPPSNSAAPSSPATPSHEAD